MAVMLIVASFMYSYTSRITGDQMKPTFTSVEALVASGFAVGYQKGSFVGEYLYANLGISKRNLRAYGTAEEYAEALLKGPNRGGVAAIFDEIPYVRLFLSGRCGFTMVGPIYKTGGFGFVFSRGSDLVADMNTAILTLAEHTALREIESKYFNTTPCSDSGTVGIGLDTFWWLFLLLGIVLSLALIVFFKMKDPESSEQQNDPSSNLEESSSQDEDQHHLDINFISEVDENVP
ncbi:hypothetical protein KI387_019182, partial [Taxus chinensis]